jgi:hypothetical protein
MATRRSVLLALALALGIAHAPAWGQATDPLPSWNDGPAK